MVWVNESNFHLLLNLRVNSLYNCDDQNVFTTDENNSGFPLVIKKLFTMRFKDIKTSSRIILVIFTVFSDTKRLYHFFPLSHIREDAFQWPGENSYIL